MTETWSYAEFIRQVLSALEAAGVDYLIGGAVAAWAWGEPRATQDLDLVVDIPPESVNRLSEELEQRGMLVPADIILDTIIETRSDLVINAIHSTTGFKAELFPLRPDDDLRRMAFQRRMLVDLGPDLGQVYVHTPEDLIIYKLWYYSLSRQTKHVRDIGAIISMQTDMLDYQYIEGWVEKRGLTSVWREILDQLGQGH